MDTIQQPTEADYLAPDGSEIRLLVSTPRGGMAHCRLPANTVTKPVWHKSVEEIWYCMSGSGELWRKYGQTQTVTPLQPGTSVLIGYQERFQFRAFAEPLQLILATIPAWPGPEEAIDADEQRWEPTVRNP